MPKPGPGEQAAGAGSADDSLRFFAGLIHASDEELVGAMGQGSEAAFEVFYARHRLSVRALCRRVLGSNDEAEDAVQHTMASIWWYLQRGRSEPPRTVRPWVYAVARNRCLAMLEARQPDAEPELGDLPAAFDLGEAVERRLELRALLRDVDDLPAEQRSALVLSELGGLSHADVADVLGRHPSSIKTLVFEARSRLADWKAARDLPCREVRRQLRELRGGALRRRTLRRHLELCEDCRAWRAARAGSGIRSLMPLLPGLRWLADLIPGASGGLLAPLGVVVIGTPLIVGGAFHGHPPPRAADPAAAPPALTAAPSTSPSALTFPSMAGGARPAHGSLAQPSAIPSPLVARSSSGVLFTLAPGWRVTGPGYKPGPTRWAGLAPLLGVAPPPAAVSSSSGPSSSAASATASTSGTSTSGSTPQPGSGAQGNGGGQSESGQGQSQSSQAQGQGDQGANDGGGGGAAGPPGSDPASVPPGRGHATGAPPGRTGTPPPGRTRASSPGQQSTQGPSSSSGQGEQSHPGLPEPVLPGNGPIPPAVRPTPPAGGLHLRGDHGGGPPLAAGGPLPPGHGRSWPLQGGRATA